MFRMRSLLCIGLFLSTIFSPHPSFGKASSHIIVGSDREYPPYEFVENGTATGFNVELMAAVGRVMGLEVEFRTGPWNKILRDLQDGNIDALSGMVYSEERAKTFAFSIPHSLSFAALFVRNDSPVHSFDEVRGKEIIVQKDDIMHDYLRKSGLTSRIIAVSDHPEALRLLASGKHDAALLPARVHALYVAKQFSLNNLRVVTPNIPPQQRCFAVARGNTELLYKLDEGLNIIKATGEYRKIYEKWFGVYEATNWWETIKYYVFALTLIALFFVVSLIWSWSLKRQVTIRTKALRRNEEELRKAHAELELRVQERTTDLARTNTRLETEIIEHKKTEEALKISELRYRTVVDSFDGFIYTCSPDYRIEFMNKQLIERTGRDATGELCYKVLHERDSICPWCTNKRVMNGETVRWEVRSPKDGRWYYAVNTPIRHANGTISKQAVIIDITEEKLAQTAVHESEEKYRSLVENLNIGVFRTTFGSPGKFIEFNPATVNLSGYESREALMQASLDDLYQNPEDRAMIMNELQEKGFIKNREVMMKRQDGSIVWVSLSMAVQRDQQGNIKWVDGVGEDITERRRTEQALANARVELERSNQELDQFAVTVSHDLKAPLTTIGGFASVLQELNKAKLDEQSQRSLNHIIKAVERMNLLINNLLGYARVASGNSSFHPLPCERALEIALANLATDIEKNQTVITRDTLPVVFGDETQYVQLFQNLIGNAIKYRSEQTPRIHISSKRISGSKADGNGPPAAISTGWLFSVSDNGIGIHPADYERVFDIFHRLDHKPDESSTGIGLALCKKIVERHGGNIWVESIPGSGTTLYFTVPDADFREA